MAPQEIQSAVARRGSGYYQTKRTNIRSSHEETSDSLETTWWGYDSQTWNMAEHLGCDLQGVQQSIDQCGEPGVPSPRACVGTPHSAELHDGTAKPRRGC